MNESAEISLFNKKHNSDSTSWIYVEQKRETRRVEMGGKSMLQVVPRAVPQNAKVLIAGGGILGLSIAAVLSRRLLRDSILLTQIVSSISLALSTGKIEVTNSSVWDKNPWQGENHTIQ